MGVRTSRLNKLARAARGPVMELLEHRRVFSVSFADGVVHVVGTNLADSINVEVFYDTYNGKSDGPEMAVARVTVNGRKQTFRGVVGVEVDARGGDDQVGVGARNNAPPDWEGVSTTLLGGSGNDMLCGGLTNDYIDGGAGDDGVYSGYGGNDSLFGGDGADGLMAEHRLTVYICSGAGNDYVYLPGAGTDGRDAYDHAVGGGRDRNNAPVDQVDGRPPLQGVVEDGVLVITGSSGADEIFLYSSESLVCFQVTDGQTGDRSGAFRLNQVVGVRIIAGDGDDHITLWPGDLRVTIQGGNGDDRIIGGRAGDTIETGPGSDWVDATGGARVTDLSADDRLIAAADVVQDAGGIVRVTGTDLDDRVYVSSAGDELTIRVNTAEYHFAGVTGLYVDVGAGDDVVDQDYALMHGADPQAPMTLLGGAGDDWLIAGRADNLIDGGAGDDHLWSLPTEEPFRLNRDTLIGGAGDDILGAVGAGGVQLGGAGENLIWRYTPGYSQIASAGDDNTGIVEADDGIEYLPPDNWDYPAKFEADDKDEDGKADDDGGTAHYGGDDVPIDQGQDEVAPVEGSESGGDLLLTTTPATVWARAGAGSMFGKVAVKRPWDDEVAAA